VCVYTAGVISVIGLITDITSAASAVPDKRAVCVVRPSSYGINCGGENDPPSDGEGGWSSANLGTQRAPSDSIISDSGGRRGIVGGVPSVPVDRTKYRCVVGGDPGNAGSVILSSKRSAKRASLYQRYLLCESFPVQIALLPK